MLSMNMMDTEIGVMGSFNYSGMCTDTGKQGRRERKGGGGCRVKTAILQKIGYFWAKCSFFLGIHA